MLSSMVFKIILNWSYVTYKKTKGIIGSGTVRGVRKVIMTHIILIFVYMCLYEKLIFINMYF